MELKNVSVSIDGKRVVDGINLVIGSGAVHAVMGPNGSGKSSLAFAIAGHPCYVIEAGSIIFNNQDITQMAPESRARLGIFLSMQNPPTIPGVSVLNFLQEIYRACVTTNISSPQLKELIDQYMQLLHIDSSFLYRTVHEGFSGGEKKRFEMLQLLLLRPQFVILDEIDSGLDIDALSVVARAINRMKQENAHISFLIITHNRRLLDYVRPDQIHIFVQGSLVYSGDQEIVTVLERDGYHAYQKSV